MVNAMEKNQSPSQCSSCRDDLEGYEIESPYHDKDGTILCDKCHEDKYQHLCHICEDFFYEDMDAKISPKYIIVLEDGNGVPTGIYEITSYPFFVDGMIEYHIFKNAVKRICDAPSEIESHYEAGYICDKCANELLESELNWRMRCI